MFSELGPTTKTPQMEMEKMMKFVHGVFHAKELFINSRHLKYFLSGYKLIFYNELVTRTRDTYEIQRNWGDTKFEL